MSWKAISIDYPLYVEVNNLIFFSAQLGGFDYFTAKKQPNLGNWSYDFLIKIGLL